MSPLRALAALALVALLPACTTLPVAQRDRVDALVREARPAAVDCASERACAIASPLRDLAARAFADSTDAAPRHYAVILDHGTDALLARVHLIRSATTSIDLQTYIFAEDDSGRLVLDELIAAAHRGVRVRVLIDQLAALERVETLAALSAAHANFELRVYNPVLGRARVTYWQYVVGTACCFRRLNQRMHTKLLVVDEAVGITGGRNYEDDYYDWNPTYNFRDRDLLVAGPEVRAMAEDFDRFWADTRSVAVHTLRDVGRLVLDAGVPALEAPRFAHPDRAQAMRDAASDAEAVRTRLVAGALPVGKVEYVSDTPEKHAAHARGPAATSGDLRGLIDGARDEVLLQTPYLVLSDNAQRLFRTLREREDPPTVIVSTNSLAATDAFIVYALSHKYKRRYLREFGFNIYEYKPFPADAPIDIAATRATLPPLLLPGEAAPAPAAPPPRWRPDRSSVVRGRAYRDPLAREYAATRYTRRAANEPVPLKRAGVRIGLHAKSLVVDNRVGVVGTHNFDPRGDRYNTESAVIIEDAAFAQALAASIRRDMAPANSWAIARRDKPPVLSGLDYSIGKAAEALPVFDLWPLRYATSYEYVPRDGCPLPPPLPSSRDFRRCHAPVGDFPEVDLGLKRTLTRIFTGFGAGLAPIL